MTSRDTETLAELMSARAGQRGSGLPTWEQVSERAVDPDSGYRPSANLLWKVASGQDVKVNPPLMRAIAAGFSLPLERVQAAAARQFLGWQIGDPFSTPAGDTDAVVRVAHRAGAEGEGMPATRAFIEQARKRDQGD
ncbi:hypothetical protein [Streptomyces sp. t39]|uniref:hypothetical protein n=1 Tax=Streptomyces sp. t39 TaxID=1828156 RepID=UPI0011CE7748|nr:hypothetical protein [Streptomyces sp. t39]TXS55219.1 hypothetical protein EAO77_02660 [Streptomyces sp. t39]